jgi:hypothetical protein
MGYASTAYLLQHCHSRIHTDMCVRGNGRGAAVMDLQQQGTTAATGSSFTKQHLTRMQRHQ